MIIENTAGSTPAFLDAATSVLNDTIVASLTVNGDAYLQNGSTI